MNRLWPAGLLLASSVILAFTSERGPAMWVLGGLASKLFVWFLVLGAIAWVIWLSRRKKKGVFLVTLSVLFFMAALAELGVWMLGRHVRSQVISLQANQPADNSQMEAPDPLLENFERETGALKGIVCVDEIPACIQFPASAKPIEHMDFRDVRGRTDGMYERSLFPFNFLFRYIQCPPTESCVLIEAQSYMSLRGGKSLVFEETLYQGRKAYHGCVTRHSDDGRPWYECSYFIPHNGYVLIPSVQIFGDLRENISNPQVDAFFQSLDLGPFGR